MPSLGMVHHGSPAVKMKTGNAKKGLFSRLRKTGDALSGGLAALMGSGPGVFDDTVFEALEDQLIMADLGVTASGEAVAALRRHAASKRIENLPALKNLLSHELAAMLGKAQRSIDIQSQPGMPFVILMVGVNGAGKTTTAAKLAAFFQRSERSVMLAACDTFRAAAIEQLQTWGERLELPVIAQAHGADAAAVAHDAMKAAQARKIDVLIVDSAGRQHVNVDLMAQLQKIKRVIGAVNVAAPQETLLVVDGGTGQNALAQVAAFEDAVGPTGVCVTKLDGTARGGIVVALARQCALTIPFIGVGETLEDLQPFDADRFARALVGIDS